ncbi:hypothetical protein [Methylocella sp.]|uniref:hypothetical protein n=1 Tax=Methylocella sp. TaxID=1978226 RepID=UPI003784848D
MSKSPLLLCVAFCLPTTVCAAHPYRHDVRHVLRHAPAQAEAGCPIPPPTQQKPDWRVQYGCVIGPASGSLGAMLEGRNPAAGAIP